MMLTSVPAAPNITVRRPLEKIASIKALAWLESEFYKFKGPCKKAVYLYLLFLINIRGLPAGFIIIVRCTSDEKYATRQNQGKINTQTMIRRR